MKEGIYFNHKTREVISLPAGGEVPGDGWVHASEQQECRLLRVRQILVDRGLVREATGVYWHMPQPAEDPLAHIEEFRRCAA